MAFLIDNLQYYLQVSNLRDLYYADFRFRESLFVYKTHISKLNGQQFFYGTKRMVNTDRVFILMYQFFSQKFKPVGF